MFQKMQKGFASVAALVVLALLSLISIPAMAAVDVSGAVAELEGMLIPIGLLGLAALIVTVTIKVWKRIRGAA